MSALAACDQMFPPYPDDLFWKLLKKLKASLSFQGISPRDFWVDVRTHESWEWSPKNRFLLCFFLDDPVPDDVLGAIVGDDNGQLAADDPRRLDLALDAVYVVLRSYENFIHIGPA